VPRDLNHDVRGGAEAVEADPAARLEAADFQRAIADHAAAKQRRRLKIAKA
jgi:hypothetical protein